MRNFCVFIAALFVATPCICQAQLKSGAVPHLTPDTKIVYVPIGSISNDRGVCIQEGIFEWNKESTYDKALYDIEGNQLTEYTAKASYGWFSSGVCIYKWNGDDGIQKRAILYKNMTYKELPAAYTQISNFVDGVAVAVKSTKVGYSTTSKMVYLDTQCKEVYPALASQKQASIPVDYPRRISDEVRAYFDFDKSLWGFADDKGKIIIPAAYKKVEDFSNGLAAVVLRMEGSAYSWGYIDKTGKVILKDIMETNNYGGSPVPGKFCDSLMLICHLGSSADRIPDKYFYIDYKGDKKSPNYQFATDFQDGYAFVRVKSWNEAEQHTVIDLSFQKVGMTMKSPISGDYVVPRFMNGMALIPKSGGTQYFVAPNGKIVVGGVNYNDYLSDFRNEQVAYCRAIIGDKTIKGLINIKGEFTIVFSHDQEYKKGAQPVPPLKKL